MDFAKKVDLLDLWASITLLFTLRKLLPAYSTRPRFPQMSFIKDRKAEYERTVEQLIQEAKQADGFIKDSSKISEEVWVIHEIQNCTWYGITDKDY